MLCGAPNTSHINIFFEKILYFFKKGLTILKQCGIIVEHSEIMNVRYRGMEQLGSSSGS